MARDLRYIINADDFGMDDDTCEQTIRCLQDGVTSSASIMPTMPATRVACEYAQRHGEFSYGVHLTFVRDTYEQPAAPVRAIRTLLDEQGRFRPSNKVRMRAIAGRIEQSHIEAEVEAQLSRVRDYGIRISHVDSHGHLHKFPVFQRALEAVLPRFGVCRVRNQQNIYARRAWRSPMYWLAKTWRPVARGPWRTTDWFFMPAGDTVDRWPDWLLQMPQSGSIEVGVHPGMCEAWRAKERENAYRLKDLLKEKRIAVVTWSDV